MERPYAKVIINKKAEKLLKSGHPWVYGEETQGPAEPYENGDIVDVFTEKGSWMGSGFINDNSKIRVRLISRNTNDRFDEAFWRRRVEYAVDYRKVVMGPDFACCRLIFGEADSFPGLTVDKFEDVLITEVLSLGIEKRKDLIYRLLKETLEAGGCKVRCIYERNEAALRLKEGMEQGKGAYRAPLFAIDQDEPSAAGPAVRQSLPCGLSSSGRGLSYTSPAADGHVVITENGVLYDVDFVNGQKTGFFLDQKYNRAAASKLAAGMRVLDCFTHTGAFALNCVSFCWARFPGPAVILRPIWALLN